LQTSGGTRPSEPTWVSMIRGADDASLAHYWEQHKINMNVYERKVQQTQMFLNEIEHEMEKRGLIEHG